MKASGRSALPGCHQGGDAEARQPGQQVEAAQGQNGGPVDARIGLKDLLVETLTQRLLARFGKDPPRDHPRLSREAGQVDQEQPAGEGQPARRLGWSRAKVLTSTSLATDWGKSAASCRATAPPMEMPTTCAGRR